MWSLLQELNTDIVEVIEIDDNSNIDDDNEDKGIATVQVMTVSRDYNYNLTKMNMIWRMSS